VKVHANLGLALAMLREDRAARRALRRMPKPVPWEWAQRRLVPLLAGPRIDEPGEPIVRATMDPGVAVIFGIDVGAAFPTVDAAVAARWECSPAQIQDVAMANLKQWTARLEPTIVRGATLSGHHVRMIEKQPTWASSILLVPDQLRRLFGSHDQMFAAPRTNTLLGFSLDVPTRVAADIVVDFEAGAPYPLMLDPFRLEDGELTWVGTDDWGDEP
jgi:hypothetical protein